MKNFRPLAYQQHLRYYNLCYLSDFKKRTAHYLKWADHSYPFLVRDDKEKNNFAILPAKAYAQIAALLYLTERVHHASQPPESVHSLDEIITHFQLDFTLISDAYTRQFSDEAFQDLVRIFDENIHDEDASRLTIRHIIRTVEKLPLPEIKEVDLDDDTDILLDFDDNIDLGFDDDDADGDTDINAGEPLALDDLSSLCDSEEEEEESVQQVSQSISQKPAVEIFKYSKRLEDLFKDALFSLHLRDHARVRGDNLIVFSIAENSVFVDRVLSIEDNNLYLLFEEEDEGLFR